MSYAAITLTRNLWIQDRHAVVHFGDEIVWLGDEHRARLQHLNRRLVLPFIPATKVIGSPSARVKYQAACRLRYCRLHPSCDDSHHAPPLDEPMFIQLEIGTSWIGTQRSNPRQGCGAETSVFPSINRSKNGSGDGRKPSPIRTALPLRHSLRNSLTVSARPVATSWWRRQLASLGIADPPPRDRAGRASNCTSNRPARHAVRSQKHDPSPLPQTVLRPRRARQTIKIGAFLDRQNDRCRFRDAAHASLNHDSFISDSRY